MLSSTNVGHVDDIGLLPGTMKLVGEAGTPKKFFAPGVEKSSITLLKIIPVLFPTTLDPKIQNSTTKRVDSHSQDVRASHA